MAPNVLNVKYWVKKLRLKCPLEIFVSGIGKTISNKNDAHVVEKPFLYFPIGGLAASFLRPEEYLIAPRSKKALNILTKMPKTYRKCTLSLKWNRGPFRYKTN